MKIKSVISQAQPTVLFTPQFATVFLSKRKYIKKKIIGESRTKNKFFVNNLIIIFIKYVKINALPTNFSQHQFQHPTEHPF